MNFDERIDKLIEAINRLADAVAGEQVDTDDSNHAVPGTSKLPQINRRKQAEQLLEDKDGSGQTNTYQILKNHYEYRMFDVRKAHTEAFKRCSMQRLLGELKLLEAEKCARPIDDLRLQWILERV